MIAATLAQRFPIVICDEHQDCNGDQHAISMAIMNQGARLRIFADPLQRIFRESALPGSNPAHDWTALLAQAQAYEQLDTPHRWSGGSSDLGQWTLSARAALMSDGKINLRNSLPSSVTVVFAENQGAQKSRVPTYLREQTFNR